MECPDCGEPVTKTDTTCPSCGKSLADLNLNEQDSKEYLCRTCGEELEFISTYKQWYCYNCQEYVDLPEQIANDLPTEIEKKSDELMEDHRTIELGVEKDEESDLDPEPSSDISWDEGDEANGEVIEGDTIEDITDDIPEHYGDDAEDDEDSGSDDFENDQDEVIGDAELSWDDADESLGEEEVEEENKDAEFSGESPHEKVVIKDPSEDEEIEIDFETDEPLVDEEIEITDSIEIDDSATENASVLGQLHQAWLKVNNILGLAPEDSRVIELERKLKNALKGELEQNDAIALANSSLNEVSKLEKELKDMIHQNVSNLFHFVNSKLFLAKKIGFSVNDLEEELDNVSSLIARSEYHQAHGDLEELLNRLFELPKTQDEIMIGLDEKSEIIKELLEPRAKKTD